MKLLYNNAKTRNYRFAIYLNYYKKKLGIEMWLYDIYFFITKNYSKNFNIVKI